MKWKGTKAGLGPPQGDTARPPAESSAFSLMASSSSLSSRPLPSPPRSHCPLTGAGAGEPEVTTLELSWPLPMPLPLSGLEREGTEPEPTEGRSEAPDVMDESD